MAALNIPTARVFKPLLEPARYKGAYGGRGSGKSHFFAELMIEDALRWPGEAGEGLRGVCIREIQKDLSQSAKRLIEDKIEHHKAPGFKVFQSVIETPGDGVLIFNGMRDHNAESIKSLEGYHRAWAEEAHTLSLNSLTLLRPTIRWEKDGLASEIWFSWNPRRKTDPVDVMFRQEQRTNAISVQANWKDNPWFPQVLEQERQDDLQFKPEQYGHIWEGEYAGVIEGAYYARSLHKARQDGRIGNVAPDPLMAYRAYWDIGGTGAKSDACAIWVAQKVGKELRVLDYYEAVGQEMSEHVGWLRKRGYENALCVLPHDGSTKDRVYRVSYESALQSAGFKTEVMPNQGHGAAMARVDAGRRLFPSMWFNRETTQPGLDALGWYHEKIDEARNIGLGPEHDWASHGADAFGLMCIHNSIDEVKGFGRKIDYPKMGVA